MFTCATLVATAATATGGLNPDDTYPVTCPNTYATTTTQPSDCKRSTKFKTFLKLKRFREGTNS